MKRLLLAALVTSVLSVNASAQDAPASSGRIDFASCEKPQYPEEALREKRTGVVKMAFRVKADGAVVAWQLKRSSGHRDLDRAVTQALVKCTFTPASEGGVPKDSWIPIQYVWTLE